MEPAFLLVDSTSMGLDLPFTEERPPKLRFPQPKVLGRTNQAFPPVWLRLQIAQPQPNLEALVQAALSHQTVIDVSVHPALFGGYLRATENLLMAQGGLEIVNAVDAKHASDLIQAHLIEILSAVGRESLDFYFLKVRTALEEFQIEGALQALEMARQEGHIRFIGLSSASESPLPSLGIWQFHDAFEVLLAPPSQNGLTALAETRRVGVVASNPFGQETFAEANLPALLELTQRSPVLLPVSSPEQIALLEGGQ